MNLADITRYWGKEQPDRLALSGEFALSWSQLDRTSDAIAAGLAAAGVEPGDRVGILADNCIPYCQLMVACFKCGAILVPLNVRLAAPELVYLLRQSGISLLFSDAKHEPLARAAIDGMGDARPPALLLLERQSGPDSVAASLPSGPEPERLVVGPDHVALICYTSGTTGFPKGAMLTHGNLWSMATSRILASQMTNLDTGYLPFSLSFTGGIAGVYMPLYVVGAGMILHAAYDPEVALKTLQDERVTVFSAVPVIWEQMVRHPRFAEHDLTSLRSCFSGGAPVPLSLMTTLQDVGIPMAQAYGITEASGLGSVLPSHDAVRKLGSAGRAILHSEMRIVDEAMREVPRGEVGELTIRGPNVMKGYWDMPAETAETLVDGWLRTGDLAIMDDEGYVTLVDRRKDMIISGGLNVYPAEIEKVLSTLPGVLEVAVVGVPDPHWGETPLAVMRAQVSIDAEAVRAVCSRELADFKIPRFIDFVDEALPRNASGKLLKRDVRARYATVPASAIRLR